MNDETKAALESLRREMADGDPDWWKRECLLFAHIDGEPARLAAAREEQREACARFAVYRHDIYGWSESEQRSIENAIRATPLDATPLADELRTLRAERDRLRTWVSTVSEALGAIEPVSDCRVELGADAAASVAASLRARVAELEAQVAAARAECALSLASEYGDRDEFDSGMNATASNVLRAMDEALKAERKH